VLAKDQHGATIAKFDARISKHLDLLRAKAQLKQFAKVSTRNSFPSGTGFASSASGFAALTLAASMALGLNLDERELSILARLGSGSACRSIPGGFVEWIAGETNDDSYARQLAPAAHWDIVDVAVIVSQDEKKVSSRDGHALAANSPFWQARLESLPDKYQRMRRAILERDFTTFGRELEAEAMMMHSIMLTSAHTTEGSWSSGIYYWTADTLDLLIAVQAWREQGLDVYFTLDAGPTVHLICEAKSQQDVINAVQALETQRKSASWSISVNPPADGARLLTDDEAKAR
jgi:diphosphomevalonate decarboxylase